MKGIPPTTVPSIPCPEWQRFSFPPRFVATLTDATASCCYFPVTFALPVVGNGRRSPFPTRKHLPSPPLTNSHHTAIQLVRIVCFTADRLRIPKRGEGCCRSSSFRRTTFSARERPRQNTATAVQGQFLTEVGRSTCSPQRARHCPRLLEMETTGYPPCRRHRSHLAPPTTLPLRRLPPRWGSPPAGYAYTAHRRRRSSGMATQPSYRCNPSPPHLRVTSRPRSV